MRRVDGMGIVCHAGLLALTVLLSAGRREQGERVRRERR